jgi:uncharacterized membrane protein YczE
VRAAPVLRGGLALRLVSLVAGLFVFALGVVFFLESRLGLPPWDVLHQGIANHTPLSFGVAIEVVGVAVLLLAWLLGAPPGVGTVANAVLVGGFVALIQPLHVAHELSGFPLAGRLALLVAGLVLFGVGTALYIGAGLGAGPRDSLMLVGARRLHTRVGVVRTAIEVTALGVGVLLGGRVGIGTVLFAALIGPSVEASFWILSRTPLSR